MEFGKPEWLNALYLTPVLIVLFMYGANRRRTELAQFTGAVMRDPLAPGRSWRKMLLKTAFKVAGFVFLVLALAAPRFRWRWPIAIWRCSKAWAAWWCSTSF